MGKLEGKVAIITGAAQGMGEAQARLFAREGAKVILADINPEGKRVADEIGAEALFVQHDVSSEDNWNSIVKMAEERFGSIDILVNTAGIAKLGPIEDTTPETLELLWRVNTLGVFLGMRAVIGPMTRAGGGAIVNISSAAAFDGLNGQHAYGATKWASRGLTMTAANEFASRNVRVNAIYPGPINTPMMRGSVGDPNDLGKLITASGRVGTPEEIATATLFLVSSDSSYIFGAELAVDGGQIIYKPSIAVS